MLSSQSKQIYNFESHPPPHLPLHQTKNIRHIFSGNVDTCKVAIKWHRNIDDIVFEGAEATFVKESKIQSWQELVY